jgi:hypothetical protein
MTKTQPTIGERVRLTREIWRYPHFKAFAGQAGLVVSDEHDIYAVRMDDVIEGAEEWANEIHWYPQNGDVPAEDLERIV